MNLLYTQVVELNIDPHTEILAIDTACIELINKETLNIQSGSSKYIA